MGVPRFFGKTGPFNGDPNKTKKDGGGKGNWYSTPLSGILRFSITFICHGPELIGFAAFRGRSGEEVQDYDYNFTNARRRSNSSNHGLSEFKTKFETVDREPVFEEEFPDVDEKQGSGMVREVEADAETNGVRGA